MAGISVVIPTLNEAENIEGIISKILENTGGIPTEIIVVDDGSRDETQAIVTRLHGANPSINLLARDRPKDGLAGAVLAGARAATAGVVLVIDADGSHPPEKIPALALPVLEGKKDMVIGSRYMPGGSTPGWSRKRRLMSRAASACAWPLTDVHDALSGYFAVRRELLASIPSDAAGFKIALEILVRGGDSIRVSEVPIAFRDRELGQSKMGTGVILTYFSRLLALSGWRESQDTVRLGIAKTLLVWGVHWLVFATAWSGLHTGLGVANLIGFLGGAALNIFLKAQQLAPEANRTGHFAARIVFVSVLSFFLRSGVLATFAIAFSWPPLAAVIPAIMTGWFVMFLGYALFIWPVRGQYGSGMRWRIAALGATAYLLALRVAYLYAAPIDPGLAQVDSAAGHGHLDPLNSATASLRDAGMVLLGPSGAGFNLPSLVCWALAAACVFQTARRLYDKTTAFRALLLFSVLPGYFLAGTIFTPDTLPLALWALAIFLTATTLRWEGCLFFAVVIGAILWKPHFFAVPMLPRLLSFFGWQLLLITPVPLIAAALHLSQRSSWREAATRKTACFAASAFVFLLLSWLGLGNGIVALDAIWLPLLPLIAMEMDRPGGGGPGRLWAPTITLCIMCYGAGLYWLAFG